MLKFRLLGLINNSFLFRIWWFYKNLNKFLFAYFIYKISFLFYYFLIFKAGSD